MKYDVIKKFRDKESMDVYDVGSTYETTEKNRANDLIKKGYIEAKPRKASKEEE